ncbi:hypothetical protein ACS0TY_030912 [Phlomoides rotata]
MKHTKGSYFWGASKRKGSYFWGASKRKDSKKCPTLDFAAQLRKKHLVRYGAPDYVEGKYSTCIS